MSTLTERTQVGKQIDLATAFDNAKSFQFPFMSRVKKGSAPANAQLIYPVERYDTPQVLGAVDESDPVEYEDPSAGDAELYARVHTLEKAVRIGHLATAVTNQAGITPRNVIAKKTAKKLLELKRNFSIVALGDQESRVDDGTRGNETRGLVKWAQSTVQTHYPVDTNFLTPAASIDAVTILADYTDDTITAIAQSQYDETQDPGADYTIVAGSRWKRNLSRITFYSRNVTNMTPVRQFRQEAGDKVIMGKVDLLETDFGNYEVVLEPAINTAGDPSTAASKRLAVGFNIEKVEWRWAEAPYMKPLADTGRNKKFLVTGTGALCVLNPRTLAKWAPTS